MSISEQSKLYQAEIGDYLFGLLDPKDSYKKYLVYKDSIDNLIGFNSKGVKQLITSNLVLWEIEHYLQLLYRGSIEAFQLLKLGQFAETEISSEWTILQKELKGIVTGKLIESHIARAHQYFLKIRKSPSIVNTGTNNYKEINWNVDDACKSLLNLNQAKALILTSEYKVQDFHPTYQAIQMGKFKYSSVKKELKRLRKSVINLYKKSDIPITIDLIRLNDLLLKIRKTNEIIFR